MIALQGQVLDGRYQLGRVLGVGGMATVYLGSDRVLERQVAVKVLAPPYAQDPSFVERFRAEARTAAGLSHPNIVAMFDSGSDAGVHYLVMEYVPGQSLAELLARQPRLAPDRATELSSQVCAALAAAHAQGVVHRDVKPANVLLGGDGLVKVTDFGIAKAAAAHTVTGSGMVLGTAAYLSPEQAQGGPVDARSDLYGLGCVLYELLTGTPPFGSGDGDSPPVAVAARQVSQPPVPPSWRNPQVDAGLDAVVLTALAKQPAQRYQSATAMRSDLVRVLAGRAAAGPGGLGGAGTPTDRLPRLAAGAGTAPTGVVAGRVVGAAARRPGWARWALVAAGIVVGLLVVALLWPDDGGAPAGRGQATPTTAPARTSPSPTTAPPPSTTPPPATTPSQPGVPAALANLTAVVTAARQQGTVDHEAEEELLHQAEEVAKEGQEDDKDDAYKKVAELERKVDELIGKGKIRPPATVQLHLAVAELARAVQHAG